MAITHVANRGTTTLKAAGKTISMSPTATLASGSLIVVWSVWSNNNTGTPDDGPVSEQLSCVDSLFNPWTTINSGQNRGSPTAQNNGVQGAMHILRVINPITTSDTITVRLGTGNSLIPKAMSIEEFALSSTDHQWCMTGFPSSLLTTAADPGAISLNYLGDREILLLHLLCAEGPSTDTYTWDADYTQITGAGTTGGAADSNVTVEGGYRIRAAGTTSDTVDVTALTANRDYYQGMTGIQEYVPEATFPQTPILDDFNRANETPLSNAAGWVTSDVVYGGTEGLSVSSNLCKTGPTSTLLRGQWRTTAYSLAQEAYVTCVTAATALDDGFGLGTNGLVGDSTQGGRALWIKFPATDSASPDAFILGIGDNNSIDRWMHTWFPQGAGFKAGIRYDGDQFTGYLDGGGGWFEACAFRSGNFVESLLSLIARDQVVRLDDFGGGGFELPFIPQIYRRVFG